MFQCFWKTLVISFRGTSSLFALCSLALNVKHGALFLSYMYTIRACIVGAMAVRPPRFCSAYFADLPRHLPEPWHGRPREAGGVLLESTCVACSRQVTAILYACALCLRNHFYIFGNCFLVIFIFFNVLWQAAVDLHESVKRLLQEKHAHHLLVRGEKARPAAVK